MPTVLHLLSQRPSLTGSGVTVEALVRGAQAAGWRQAAVVGVPAEDPAPAVAALPREAIFPLLFETDALPFPVPGMSDVMPYRSTRFSAMSEAQLAAYRSAWRAHLGRVLAEVQPDVIHTHHVWILSSLVKDVAPELPAVAHCHATGLRQRALCPHLGGAVSVGCARIEQFVALHRGVALELTEVLGVDPSRVHVVGAGYREDLFHPEGRRPDVGPEILYVGKLSAAKGLPWLLTAVELLAPRHARLRLHVAGSGAGAESEALSARMEGLAPLVVPHGALPQPALASLMRRCHVLVLPSLYEGVPLVLAEARACGCLLVSTALPGVMEQLAPHLGEALLTLPPPALQGVDAPHPEALPAFVEQLAETLEQALGRPSPGADPRGLSPLTWSAVFSRVESLWKRLL